MGALVQDRPVAGRRRVAAWLVSVTLVATSLLGLAATPAEGAAVFVTPARIMPLGDNITWGTGGDGGGGYRPPLVQNLVVGRYSSDMVGSQRSGPPNLYDRDHEGYRGYRIDQIASLAAGELTAYRPEFVLLQIGTNDVLQEYQLATAPDRLSALIDLITDTAPSARLVVATNIGGDSPPSPVATATTEAAGDLIAPSAPTGLGAAAAKRKVNLSWSASTDAGGSGLAGYRVWRGTAGSSGPFSPIATTTTASYSDTTVTSKVTYWYRVTAFDGAGNESQPSGVVAATRNEPAVQALTAGPPSPVRSR